MTKVDTGTDELLCEITNRVAVVTLNKPHKKNALGDILTPALRAVLPVLESRADVGCVMITGAGNALCSGGDVSEMGSSRDPDAREPTREERIAELTNKQQTLTGVPVSTCQTNNRSAARCRRGRRALHCTRLRSQSRIRQCVFTHRVSKCRFNRRLWCKLVSTKAHRSCAGKGPVFSVTPLECR